MLEVGVGPGMVSAALRAVGIDVVTVDLQAELKPDVVASVTDLPLTDNSVDVSLCCQVLEHLPFARFESAIKELARVAALGIVLSLPGATRHYEVRLCLPKLPRLWWVYSRQCRVPAPYRDDHWQRSGHYWEVGYPETPLNRVVQVIRANNLSILRTWRVPEYPYHRFFIIQTSKVADAGNSGVRG